MLEVIALCVGFGLVLLSVVLAKRKVKKLPDLSNDEFVNKYKGLYGDVSSEAVLQERDYLARLLEIPCQKLDPSYTFDELSKHLDDSFGGYQLAIGDLESTISELFEKLGVQKPYNSPANIGECIRDIIKAKNVDKCGM